MTPQRPPQAPEPRPPYELPAEDEPVPQEVLEAFRVPEPSPGRRELERAELTPPHDLDAEAAVLGSMILDNECIHPVLQIVSVEHFYRESHRRVFEGIVSLHEGGSPVDAVLLRYELNRRGTLDVIGGPEAVVNLLDAAPTAAHAESYARIVREKAARRCLLAAGVRLAVAARKGESVSEIMVGVRGALEEVERATQGEGDLCCMADVRPERVSWVWPGYIAYGKLHIIEGPPARGKTTLALDLAARLSRGAEMPDGSGGGDPEATLLLTAEDGLGDTVRPRLEAARADLRLVHAVRAPLTFPEGVPHLGRLVSSTRAKFVIVDPIVAYLGPDVNANDDAEVRRALRPLGRMAEDRGAAVLAIRHHNKSGGTDPMTRGGGSIGFTASARCVLMVVPDDLVPAESVLSVVKANLSRTAPSLRYAIAEGTVLVDGTPCSTSQIDWRGVDGRDARTLLAARRDVVEEEKIERAEDRVLRAVEAQPGLKREELVAAAGGRRGDNGKALAVLVARGEVEKLGRGGRGDPFLYVIPSTGPNRSPTSPGPAGTGDRVQPVPRSRSIGTGGPEGPVRDHGGTGTGSGRLPFHVPEGLP